MNTIVKKQYKKVLVAYAIHVSFINEAVNFHRLFAVDGDYYAQGNARKITAREYVERIANELRQEYKNAQNVDIFPLYRLIELD